MEADFLREYGIDIREATSGRERIGLRRLRALIRGLPPRSALSRSLTSGQEWTNVEELLATIIEVVDQGNGLFYQSKTKKGARKWKPIKVGRPGKTTRRQSGRRAAPYVLKRARPELATKKALTDFFGNHGKVVVVDESVEGKEAAD